MSTPAHEFSLDEKYLREEGVVYLNGIQAFVRLLLDQIRADRRRGLRTAAFVSGYRGSPLGGLDMAVERAGALLRRHDVVFSNGLNEELAATAMFGTQMVSHFPGAKYDGVLGMWYGKGPGVDRCGDAYKHANLAGIAPNGGVLALGGDDPSSKSSTIPSASEVAFFDASFPIVYPGSVQEVLDLGLHGYALSRYAGLWVGMKCATNVCDEQGTAEVAPDRVVPRLPELKVDGRPFRHVFDPTLVPPRCVELEATLAARLEAARRYGAANGLNRIVVRGEADRVGIAAAGKTYYDVRQALRDLGLADDDLRRIGVRVLKLGLLHPLDAGIVREFARGLREVVVVEEKRAFLELFVRDALYNLAERPLVVGKADEAGRPLVPRHGELDAEGVARVLAARLAGRPLPERARARLARLDEVARREPPATLARTAYFCSGCPHNTSTVVPEGSVAGGGIGCHTLAMVMDRRTVGVTQMGGEGAQWIGMAPFTSMPHMFQNLGDGTLFHSGMQAVKAVVAAGVNVTFKILHNSAVAMTGGQTPAGAVPIPELTRQLEAEGVKAIAVVSDGPNRYRGARLARTATLHHRDELDAVQRRLREVPGTTVLVYEQQCAAEKRRLRKRGRLPDPAVRVFVNEAVCEGCGDCGVESNCLSVQPVETALGRKTRIHQSSCNKDYSCLKGDCPSFLTVVPKAGGTAAPARGSRRVPAVEAPLPEPAESPSCADGYAVYMLGVGGTGVVTVNAVLGTAARLDGKRVRGLDQTGLSQKGGPVVSSLKLLDPLPEGGVPDVANRVGVAEADLYLGFDLLVSTAPANLARAHPGRTRAVVSVSEVPTGQMVSRAGVRFPDPFTLTRAIDRHTRPGGNVYLDAGRLAERLFGDHMTANLLLLGAAYQAGLVPVRAESIERAIVLNGVSVEANRQAFRWGRLWVVDRAAVERAAAAAEPAAAPCDPASDLPPRDRAAVARLVAESGLKGEVRRLVEHRAAELAAYQSVGYARAYAGFVRRAAEVEAARAPGRTRLAEAVARSLFKLMAYKDEYEVARLLLRDEPAAEIARWFPGGATVSYNLHPPLLRALGLERKLRLGPWFRPALRALRALKALRGTPVDPFGRAEVRRVERALIGEYRLLVERALHALESTGGGPAAYDTAVALAELPDLVRGYEGIKLASVERFRAKAAELAAALEARRPAAAVA